MTAARLALTSGVKDFKAAAVRRCRCRRRAEERTEAATVSRRRSGKPRRRRSTPPRGATRGLAVGAGRGLGARAVASESAASHDADPSRRPSANGPAANRRAGKPRPPRSEPPKPSAKLKAPSDFRSGGRDRAGASWRRRFPAAVRRPWRSAPSQPEHSLHKALVVVPRARRPFLARAPRKGAGRSSA